MNASAPYSPWAGAQVSEVKNRIPMSWNAGQALRVMVTAMRARMTRTSRPEPSARGRNESSAQCRLPFRSMRDADNPSSCAPFERCAWGTAVTAGVSRSRRHRCSWDGSALELVQLRDGLAGQLRRQRGVVDVRRQGLAGGEDVVDEAARGQRLGGIGLLGVGEDPGLRRDRVGGVTVG